MILDFLARTGMLGMSGIPPVRLNPKHGSAPLFPDFLLDHPNASSLPCGIPWDDIPDVPGLKNSSPAPKSLFQDMRELFPLFLPNPCNQGWDLSPLTLVLWDYSQGIRSQLSSGRRIPIPAPASHRDKQEIGMSLKLLKFGG